MESKTSKWGIYQFRDTTDNKDAYIIAGSEDFARLKLSQNTALSFELIKFLPIEKIDRAKAWFLVNNIKPF